MDGASSASPRGVTGYPKLSQFGEIADVKNSNFITPVQRKVRILLVIFSF
jgi:hypothetical protein